MITIEQIKQLNDLEYEIYTYLVNHQSEIVKMKLKDIAEKLHVSPSMITRVCQKLGCEGFTQFKVELRFNQTQEEKSSDDSLNYLMDYFKKIDNEESHIPIKEAANIMAKSDNVIFFGIALSGAMAKYASYLFNRRGLRSFVIDDFSHRFNIYDKHSCAVVLSVSGETRETNAQIVVMKQVGMKVIVITNSENTTAAKLADVVISYYVPTHKDRYFYSSATQVPVMYIFECLAKEIEKLGVR